MQISLYCLINSPFWRIPIIDWIKVRTEFLFDLLSARNAGDFWVANASVLSDFTEQILTIDQLQPSPPKALKIKPEPCKLYFLSVSHEPNHIGLVPARSVGKT